MAHNSKRSKSQFREYFDIEWWFLTKVRQEYLPLNSNILYFKFYNTHISFVLTFDGIWSYDIWAKTGNLLRSLSLINIRMITVEIIE